MELLELYDLTGKTTHLNGGVSYWKRKTHPHFGGVCIESHRRTLFEGAPGSELYVDDLELIYP